MKGKASAALALVGAATLAACNAGFPFGVVCTTELRPNLVVEVRDAVTGRAIAEGATGRAESGSYSVDLVPVDTLTMREQGNQVEHAGTYTVVVRQDGYREWRRTDIHVEDGTCHVVTETIDARLTPDA